jgi:hypothetical protein
VPVKFASSVCLYEYKSRSAEWIFMKSDIGAFYENLSVHGKLWFKLNKNNGDFT